MFVFSYHRVKLSFFSLSCLEFFYIKNYENKNSFNSVKKLLYLCGKKTDSGNYFFLAAFFGAAVRLAAFFSNAVGS